MKSENVLLGVLAGVAVGALLGVLMAPHKGSKTRRMIAGAGEGYADDLRDKFDELLAQFSTKLESEKKSAEKFLTKIKSTVGEVSKEVHNGTI